MSISTQWLNSSIPPNESVEEISDLKTSIFQDGNLITDKAAKNDSVQLLQIPPPILEFITQINSKVCQLAESTLPASVFRTHLRLAKNEENLLAKLQNYAPTSLSANNSHVSITDGFDVRSNVGSNDSKLNFFHKSLNKPEQFQEQLVELSEENTISFEDVVSHPMVSHEGKVLVCLNATLPVITFTNESYFLSTVIEDPTSFTKAARLEVAYDLHEVECLSRSLKNPFLHAMEPGSIILLHEPIFKYNFSGEGLSICVNKIKDVVFRGHVSPFTLKRESKMQTKINYESELRISTSLTNPEQVGINENNSKASLWVPSSTCEEKYARDEWKEWGNKNLVLRRHLQALIAYTIALRFDPLSIELISAKCASLVNLGLFASALKEVDSIISQDPFNTGLIMRKTHCLWGLGMYDEAMDYLKYNLEKLSIKSMKSQYTEEECTRKRIFIQNIISKTEKMIRQSTTPEPTNNINFCKNQTQVSHIEPEYCAPISLIFKSIDENDSLSSNCKRKFAITNQPVSAGMLLAKVKAFSIVFQEDGTDEESRQDRLNYELINLTMQKLLFEKPTELQFDNLVEKEDTNSFMPGHSTTELTKSATIKFCEKYLYESNNDHSAEVSVEQTNDDEASSSSSSRSLTTIRTTVVRGLWTFPANIRHTCVGGNAIWYICGNFMYIRAICDVKEGEEILMAHVDPTKSFEFRQEFLKKKGINCSCTLCQFEKMESEATKLRMSQLLKNITELNNNALCSKEFCYLKARQWKHCLDDLEILRGAYARLNFPIVEPFYKFGLYLMKNGNFDEAIIAFEKAFLIVDKTAAIFPLLNTSFLLSYCYVAKKRNANKNRSRKWLAAAESYAKLSYGCLSPVKYKFKVEFEYLKSKNIIL